MKHIYKSEMETLNQETGEIIKSEKTHTYKIPQEDSYIKIYIKDLQDITSLPNGLDKVIQELFRYTNYDNEILLTAGRRRKIAERLGQQLNTINKYISKLIKAKVIIKDIESAYFLNPYYFGKGKWTDVIKKREDFKQVKPQSK